MDIRDRVMGDQPNDFLHKIAGIVPGFHGYMDRERRRDADKLLRVYLAHQYSDGRARLTRVQQTMVRGKNLDYIAEVDRVAGVLQRFIDRLTTATYGYTGLFDPVKIEGQDLDMLYAFDMALTAGVDQVSSAVGALESAAAASNTDANALPGALDKLSSLVDDLNNRLNQRQDFISTGRGLPQDQYDAMLAQINQVGTPPPATPTSTPEVPSTASAPYTAPPTPGAMAGTPSTGAGAPTMPMGTAPTTDTGGQAARVQGTDYGTSPGSTTGYTGANDAAEPLPETPRTSPPDTYSADQPDQMGVQGVIPPVEQWQGIPGSNTGSTSSTGGTSSAATAPGAPSSSSASVSPNPAPGTASGSPSAIPSTAPSTPAPAPSGTTGTWSSDAASGGSTSWGGDTRKISDQADDFGMGQGSTMSGNYNSADSVDASNAADDDTGIQSSAAPSLPGGDLADDTLATDDTDLDIQADDSDATKA
ncbi:MAG TPA: hypothetical protein VLQ48_11830 [Chloroflexia bacterium]|nr:hypothetical protein [Chloroflexia bacterium]